MTTANQDRSPAADRPWPFQGDDGVEYREIPGYPGYWAGTDGSIWSVRRKNYLPKKRKPSRLPTGYLSLCLGNGWPQRYVHHLVLEAFVGPRPEGTECCHGNGIRSDNRLCNLRWDTHKENYADAVRHGTAYGVLRVRPPLVCTDRK